MAEAAKKEAKTEEKNTKGAEKAEAKKKSPVVKVKQTSNWSLKKARKKANKFQTEAEWKKGAPSSYKAASHWGWLDECCSHMKERLKPVAKDNVVPIKKKKKTAAKKPAKKKTARTTRRKSA